MEKGQYRQGPLLVEIKKLNTHLSELLSEILEPVSFSIGGGEIASTEEALSRIEHINNTVLKHEDLSALNAFEEVLQTDNISQILREECGSINEKLIGDWTYLDKINLLNVSGDSEVSVLSLDSEEEQVFETLSELEKEAIASRETIALEEDEGVATVPEKKKRVKITDFFQEVDKNKFFFDDNIRERDHRQLRRRKKDFNASIKHNFMAGKIWSKSRVRERNIKLTKEAPERMKTDSDLVNGIQDDEGKYMFFGADVTALYPSLNQVETAAIVAEAVEKSSVEYAGMDFDRMCVYLYLTIGPNGMKECNLSECIPKRAGDSSSLSLNAKTNKDLMGWRFATLYD